MACFTAPAHLLPLPLTSSAAFRHRRHSNSSSSALFPAPLPEFDSDLFFNFGGGGGGGGAGGGGSNGGQGGGFWSRIFSPPAIAKDEEPQQEWNSHGLPANLCVPLKRLSGFKKNKVSEISLFDQRRRSTVGTEDSFSEMVSLRPGGIYTKAQLQQELGTLATCGMFEKVDLESKTNPDGTISITIPFLESTWRSADRFRCINVGLMRQSKPIEMDPDMTEKEMESERGITGGELRGQGHRIRNRVQQWYHENGYACAKVVNFGNLNTKELVCEVVEGDISQLVIKFEDKLGNICEGNTQIPVIKRQLLKQLRPGQVFNVQAWNQAQRNMNSLALFNFEPNLLPDEKNEGGVILELKLQEPKQTSAEISTEWSIVLGRGGLPTLLRQGQVFNIEAGKQALRNINSLALFSNIEVNPRPDEKNEGGIIVEVKLKELEQKSAEVSTEWSIVPGRGGRPTLASIQPGGTVSFEHRNIKGLNRSLLGSVTTSNFLNPQDDLAFKLEYVHPYLDGVYNPRNRTFRASCFNSRKLSPVFTGGPGIEEVPPIWVDRAGVKANITENFTRQSKFTYGLVMEEITTRDESSHIAANGQRVLASGGVSADGPPTTLSGTGVDRMAFLQANITRDNTKFLNGAIVGERNVFQLDQGLGIGSKFPFFNRHQLTVTRFLQLKQVEEGAGKPPPPVLVLHGHYGGCVGDLPSYDAFTLGGPYSVRGYNMGELGAARNILELAAELRIPIRNTHVYVFAEHGNDLGTSKDVKGNPTEVYRRMGHGSSYGAGVKLGLVRAEYAVDQNSGTGAIFFRFGERF
ncbi:UNVERIFIED_CONTAM: protein TOC75-3, chloroplastic [Sesamum latifolium]|uniref:Protein TOC75-3, chloroplastic n=1 Tax=Sesamum latifolium TaxID=2727402 RepID=A0AAW2Y427_9LAMI